MRAAECSSSEGAASVASSKAAASQAMSTNPELASRFAKLHASIVRGLQQEHDADGSSELVDTISLRLQREFDRPRIQELEFCLQKRFTADQARVLLFFPTSEEGFGMIPHWPLLVAEAPEGSPSDHPWVFHSFRNFPFFAIALKARRRVRHAQLTSPFWRLRYCPHVASGSASCSFRS